MGDIEFNIVDREVVLENGDFLFTNNPSVQNGGLIQYTKAAFVITPTLGIGIDRTIGAPVSDVTFEMNRWKQQCTNDGAKVAEFAITNTTTDYADVDIQTKVSYL